MVCDLESARPLAHRESDKCPQSRRLSRHAKRSTEGPWGEACVSERKALAREVYSLTQKKVSKQTNVYVHDSNSAEVILNPEDIRVVLWVFSTYVLLQDKT